MKKIYNAVMLGASLLIVFGCMGQESGKKLKRISKINYEELETKIPQLLEKYDVPAVSISLIEQGNIKWSSVFGMQNQTKKADKNTLFLSASIAKPVTAEVFLRLASMGKVSLDEPMCHYWTDPDIKDHPFTKLLTPRHVLTHQTGFKNWRYMTNDTLRFESRPGMEVGYSGEGLRYLVRFIEKKLNRPFNDIANEVLFTPEKMSNSSFKKQDWYDNRLAAPKFADGNWGEPFARDEAIGAGGLHTTSEEYARFVLSIMNKTEVSKTLRKEQFIISKNQNKECIASATNPEACPKNLGFGLSWYVYEFEEETIIAHSGANNGERTLAVFNLKSKWGLVVMTNGGNGNYVIYDIAKLAGVNQNFIAIEKPRRVFVSND